MFFISKMVCEQKKVPSLYGGIAIESLKEAKDYVKFDINKNLQQYDVKKSTTKKDGDGCMIIVEFADKGFAVYKVGKLRVAQKKGSKPKTVSRRQRRSGGLDSVEEAIEDARYIAEVNDYINKHC